jgi:hypothetical protein
VKHILEIHSADVSDAGPFAPGTVFFFKPTINFVVGDYGSGKTTLAIAINTELVRIIRTLGREEPFTDLMPIMFVDESMRPPYPGESWDKSFGSGLLTPLLITDADRTGLVERFQDHLREIMDAKIAGQSKFSGNVTSSRDISVRYSDDSRIDIIHTETGDDLNWAFQAAGERVAMFIALLCALREGHPYGFQLPLVWDGFGEILDRSLVHSCFSAISKLEGQVILLIQRNVADTLGVSADIDLNSARG